MSALTVVLAFIAGFVSGSVFGVALLALLVGGSPRSRATPDTPADDPGGTAR